MHKLLEVKNLKKYFETKNGLLHAVDGVDFSIDSYYHNIVCQYVSIIIILNTLNC